MKSTLFPLHGRTPESRANRDAIFGVFARRMQAKKLIHAAETLGKHEIQVRGKTIRITNFEAKPTPPFRHSFWAELRLVQRTPRRKQFFALVGRLKLNHDGAEITGLEIQHLAS